MNFLKIASPANTKIKAAFKIKKRLRTDKQRMFFIEGPHLLEMAIARPRAVAEGMKIHTLIFSASFFRKQEGQRLVRKVAKIADECIEVTDSIVHKLTETETPQGIIAIASYTSLSMHEVTVSGNPLLVVIDGIQDPGNLGTIIRTADAAGVEAVVLTPGTCNAYMPKTVRSTAGSIFNVPVLYGDPDDIVTWLRRKKIRCVVTSAAAQTTIYEADLTLPAALVVGNESHGVSEQLEKSADMILGIPIYGKAESLNVATAAAICLFEAVRQRGSRVSRHTAS